MNEARIRSLQGTPVFGGIVDSVIALLLEQTRTVEVRAKDTFFEQGDRGTSAFVLERGEVAVFKQWDGKSQLLRRMSAGDCFGEVALLDFGPRSATILAETDCTAIEISARDLTHVAERDPEQFAMIYMNLGRELSRRLRDADERLFRARVERAPCVEGYTFLPA